MKTYKKELSDIFSMFFLHCSTSLLRWKLKKKKEKTRSSKEFELIPKIHTHTQQLFHYLTLITLSGACHYFSPLPITILSLKKPRHVFPDPFGSHNNYFQRPARVLTGPSLVFSHVHGTEALSNSHRGIKKKNTMEIPTQQPLPKSRWTITRLMETPKQPLSQSRQTITWVT